MKRRSALVVAGLAAASASGLLLGGLLLYGCNGGTPASWGPVDGTKAMKHVAEMVGHGPRPSGSPALERTQAYIGSELEKLGLKVHKQAWKDPSQPRVRMFRNIWTQIDGEDPATGPILILAAHYDTKLCQGHGEAKHNFPFVGAIDGAGGPGTLLELARHLVTRKSVPNIWLLFLDGEESIPFEWDKTQSLYGSRYFVQQMSADKQLFPNGMPARVRAFVLIDLIGSKNQKIDEDHESNRTLIEIFGQAADKMGEKHRMYASKSLMIDDHLPFKNGGMRVIDLIDFNDRVPGRAKKAPYEQWWHTANDNLAAMDPVSLSFVGNLLWTALPLLEAKYYPATRPAANPAGNKAK